MALVGLGRIHNGTASTAFVGRGGFTGPSRDAIRYADRMDVSASRSDGPAAQAASPSSEESALKSCASSAIRHAA